MAQSPLIQPTKNVQSHMASTRVGKYGLVASVAANVLLGAFVARQFWADPASTHYGEFINSPPKVSLSDNGRDITLLEDFGYRDRRNTLWVAPSSYVSNGASIPRALWTAVGSPLEGKYRNAAIIHDAACDAMKKPPADVHTAFYEACRCGGLGEWDAKLLYAGVIIGCRRWQLVPEKKTRSHTVATIVAETRVKTVLDPETGEPKEVTYTVQVPVAETKESHYTVFVPQEVPGVPVEESDVEAIKTFFEDRHPSVKEIDAWIESRTTSARDRGESPSAK